MKHTVGIVLTTYNFVDKTRACLDSLARSTHYPHRLVVVDNNSTDATLEFLRARGVDTLALQQKTGLAAALNRGFRYLTAYNHLTHIAWIHNDMLFFPGWLSKLLDVLDRHPDVAKLSPWNWIGNPAYYTDEMAERFTAEHRDHIEPRNGCPWVMPVDIMRRVGPFDERYEGCGGYEDWDYNNRVLALNRKVACTKGSVIWHETMATRSRMEHREVALRNYALYISKWGPEPRV